MEQELNKAKDFDDHLDLIERSKDSEKLIVALKDQLA